MTMKYMQVMFSIHLYKSDIGIIVPFLVSSEFITESSITIKLKSEVTFA